MEPALAELERRNFISEAIKTQTGGAPSIIRKVNLACINGGT
jgi:hypothetical protein